MSGIQDSSTEPAEGHSSAPSPRLSVNEGGRQLPTIPSSETGSGGVRNSIMSNKQAPPVRGTAGYGPFVQEYSMMAEYNLLHKHKLPGVYVMPSSKSALIWNGLIFLRQGLYEGCALRFTLTIPDNYPDGECPDFQFEFPIFHPMVEPQTGKVDIKRAFTKWRRNVNHLWQVLMYIRKIFYKIETNSPLNTEAATQYEQDTEQFRKQVSESIQTAKQRLMQPPTSDDPFALRFSPWTEPVHQEAKQQMLNSKVLCAQESTQ